MIFCYKNPILHCPHPPLVQGPSSDGRTARQEKKQCLSCTLHLSPVESRIHAQGLIVRHLLIRSAECVMDATAFEAWREKKSRTVRPCMSHVTFLLQHFIKFNHSHWSLATSSEMSIDHEKQNEHLQFVK